MQYRITLPQRFIKGLKSTKDIFFVFTPLGLLVVDEEKLLKTLLFLARNNDAMTTYITIRLDEHDKEILKSKFPELDFKKFNLMNLDKFEGVVY